MFNLAPDPPHSKPQNFLSTLPHSLLINFFLYTQIAASKHYTTNIVSITIPPSTTTRNTITI